MNQQMMRVIFTAIYWKIWCCKLRWLSEFSFITTSRHCGYVVKKRKWKQKWWLSCHHMYITTHRHLYGSISQFRDSASQRMMGQARDKQTMPINCLRSLKTSNALCPESIYKMLYAVVVDEVMSVLVFWIFGVTVFACHLKMLIKLLRSTFDPYGTDFYLSPQVTHPFKQHQYASQDLPCM